MIGLVKLVPFYVNRYLFVLTALSKNKLNTCTRVKIGSVRSTVRAVRVHITTPNDSRFRLDFVRGVAIFTTDCAGKYRLPLTSSQHLTESPVADCTGDYIQLESSTKYGLPYLQYVRLEVAHHKVG